MYDPGIPAKRQWLVREIAAQLNVSALRLIFWSPGIWTECHRGQDGPAETAVDLGPHEWWERIDVESLTFIVSVMIRAGIFADPQPWQDHA